MSWPGPEGARGNGGEMDKSQMGCGGRLFRRWQWIGWGRGRRRYQKWLSVCGVGRIEKELVGLMDVSHWTCQGGRQMQSPRSRSGFPVLPPTATPSAEVVVLTPRTPRAAWPKSRLRILCSRPSGAWPALPSQPRGPQPLVAEDQRESSPQQATQILRLRRRKREMGLAGQLAGAGIRFLL